MKFLHFKILFVLSLIAVILVTPMTSVRATADSVSSEQNDITITPAKFNIALSQADSVDNYIRIVNNNNYEVLVSLKLENIGIVREDGEVVIGGTHSGYPSILKDWVKFYPEAVNVAANQASFIKMSINVPKDAPYGGRYSSIVAKSAKVESVGQANETDAMLASLIMLSVVGDTKNQASVKSFYLDGKGGGNYDIVTRVQNTGSDHIKPRGMIVVSDLWGKKIDEIVFNGDNVLPGAIRRTILNWQMPKGLLGVYNVAFISNYGYQNEGTLTASHRFVAHPWIFYLSQLLIVVIIVLMYLIIKRIVERKIKY